MCFLFSPLLSRQYSDPVVGPCPEAAVLGGLRPQRHHVGHRGPQRTDVTVAGPPVSPSVFHTHFISTVCQRLGGLQSLRMWCQEQLSPGTDTAFISTSGPSYIFHHLLVPLPRYRSHQSPVHWWCRVYGGLSLRRP